MAKELKASVTTVASEDYDRRMIKCGPGQDSGEFLSNAISTTKYSVLTWAPKSLLWQFRKAANVYFLIISILSMMPFSPKKWASLVITFSSVLFMTMLKEAYEDYFRYKQDRKVNTSKTRKVTKRGLADIQFQDVKVGDILQVKENESFPADLILLSCADQRGVAFINTMNLDGETNLKERISPESTKSLRDPSHLYSTDFTVNTDEPNPSLLYWNCNLQVNHNQWIPLSQSQLLLRGCTLKNTEHVFGLVIYTGHETKVMLNSKEAGQKMSYIMRKMNLLLITVFVFQGLICFVYAGFGLKWQIESVQGHDYLGVRGSPDISEYFERVMTFLVAYSHLIPISLYVALEVLKLTLAYFINQDIDMYYSEDDRPASCRTSDLVEELGAVEFIFTDKTGTLTRNVMELKKVAIGENIYGGSERNEDFLSLAGDRKPAEIIENGDENASLLERFFTELSICHAVFPTLNPLDSDRPRYQAPSPDDLALVQGSADMGFTFFDKEDRNLTVKLEKGGKKVWEVLAEIPFTSDRRRMSIVVREPDTGRILLMTKGADSTLIPRLSITSSQLSTLSDHLRLFALEGLRTLVIAQRELPPEEFQTWIEERNDLLLSAARNKEAMLEANGEKIEVNLELLGATAIEDKLQEGVPETIALLLKAQIRMWVLTGDKQETAIEIGKACNLITSESILLNLSSDSKEQFQRELQRLMEIYQLIGANNDDLDAIKKGLEIEGKKLAIVVNGVTLAWVLDQSLQMRRDFFKLGYIANSCICCRVSPAQKMQVVDLVKSQGKWITLAIGDGANDVSMIQEAHIGVGIAGKEGAQAVQASDFAFSQFRYLQKLLLVHGRWGYRRVSVFICYYFYKNIVAVFTELWFAWFNGFSGQIYFADWLPQLYNALWTSWPCMGTFIFERDLDGENSLKYPVLYRAGQLGLYFTYGQFWKWVLLGIWHGLVCYWVPALAFDGLVSYDGKDTGLWWVSTLSFTLVMHIVTYKLLLESIYMNNIILLTAVLSILGYYASVLVLNFDKVSQIFQPQLNQVFYALLCTAKVRST